MTSRRPTAKQLCFDFSDEDELSCSAPEPQRGQSTAAVVSAAQTHEEIVQASKVL